MYEILSNSRVAWCLVNCRILFGCGCRRVSWNVVPACLHFFSPTTLLPPICTCQDQDQVKTRTPRTAAMHASRIANNESPAQTTNQPLRLQSLLLSITASQVHSYPRKPATRFGIEATIVPLALVPLRGLLHPTQLYFVLCTARTVSETHSTSQLHTTHDA